jgi:hypothetical protein
MRKIVFVALNTSPFLDLKEYQNSLPPSADSRAETARIIFDEAQVLVKAQRPIDDMLKLQTGK